MVIVSPQMNIIIGSQMEDLNILSIMLLGTSKIAYGTKKNGEAPADHMK